MVGTPSPSRSTVTGASKAGQGDRPAQLRQAVLQLALNVKAAAGDRDAEKRRRGRKRTKRIGGTCASFYGLGRGTPPTELPFGLELGLLAVFTLVSMTVS